MQRPPRGRGPRAPKWVNMTESQMLQKLRCYGGPIFKVDREWKSTFSNLFFCISMTFNVILSITIAVYKQANSLILHLIWALEVGCHCVVWYKAKILGYWDQKDQSDLQIWCTPGNTNHTRVPIDIFYPTRCHEFYLVWCDISKSHCEEDPSNYAGLKKRNNCRRWKRFLSQG